MSLPKVPSFCSASTSSSAPPLKTRPLTEVYNEPVVDSLHINHEHTILDQTLTNISTAEWGLRRLAELHLHVLFFISGLAYPRLVRQFYQNLSKASMSQNNPPPFHTYIDGFYIPLSSPIITFALNLAPEPLDIPRPTYSQDQVFRELGSAFPNCKYAIRRVHLPPRMWIIDHILRRTIFPLGDKKIKSSRTLQALTAVARGQWFDFGKCILQDLWFVKKDIRARGRNTHCMLEFPRIITRILEVSGYPISPDEISVSQFPVFNSTKWMINYRQLTSQRMVEECNSGKGNQILQTFVFPRTQLRRLERSLSIVSQKQDHILRIQKDLAHANMQQNLQLYSLETILLGLVAEQNPEAAERITDRLIATGELYRAPTFNLNTDVQEPVMADEAMEEEEGEIDEDNL